LQIKIDRHQYRLAFYQVNFDNNTLFKNLILHVEIKGMRNPNIIIKETSVLHLNIG